MARLLEEWNIRRPRPSRETGSINSHENAKRSYHELTPRGIRRILLVTSAMHMPGRRELFVSSVSRSSRCRPTSATAGVNRMSWARCSPAPTTWSIPTRPCTSGWALPHTACGAGCDGCLQPARTRKSLTRIRMHPRHLRDNSIRRIGHPRRQSQLLSRHVERRPKSRTISTLQATLSGFTVRSISPPALRSAMPRS
jgi:hypothetical protein